MDNNYFPSPEKVGLAFRIILERLKTIKDEPNNCEPKCKWGCLNCIHHVREESYDQQWGMYQFYGHKCKKGLEDKYIVKYGDIGDCEFFEEGEETLIYMSDKEKKHIEGGGKY